MEFNHENSYIWKYLAKPGDTARSRKFGREKAQSCGCRGNQCCYVFMFVKNTFFVITSSKIKVCPVFVFLWPKKGLSFWKQSAPFMMSRKKENGEVFYTGYCIDLLNELVRNLKFTYEIYFTPDGFYGAETDNGTWNGIIGELLYKVWLQGHCFNFYLCWEWQTCTLWRRIIMPSGCMSSFCWW